MSYPNPNVAPAVTYPSPNEWPSTIQTISAISKAANAQFTVANHGFTDSDVGVTTVIPLKVLGMIQINGLPGVIQNIVDNNNFTVNINTTNFSNFTGLAQLSTVTGSPPLDQVGAQFFNLPFKNTYDPGA